MKTLALKWSAVVVLLMLAMPADATRRSIRVDGFGDWAESPIPSANCPGTSVASTLLQRFGYVFSGREQASYLTDTYCQVPSVGNPNQISLTNGGEAGLGTLVGPNVNQAVNAIRYSFLDRPRFDFNQPATGFQWMFFQFPAGATIVGLYGLQNVTLTSTSYIRLGVTRIWDGQVNGFDGEYFCFQDGVFIGTWNGTLPSSSNCVKAASRIFRGQFE